MPASINDKLKKYKSLFSTTLSTGIGTGTSDTITPATVTGLPTDTAITLTIDRVDASGTVTPSKMERIKGVVSSGNIINYVRAVDGTTEQAHTAGAVVEMVWNADDWNNAVDHLLVEHGQDGKHTKVNGNTVTAGTDTVALLTASQTLTNKTLTSPKINEDVALTATATQLNAQVLAGNDGWTSANETWTYVSADDPTFTFKIAGVDLTTKYSAGMRIKLTQTTVKYFIITAVAFSTDTTITVYGGTDYNIDDAAISLNYYSTQKAPQGFPLSPDKWSVIVTDTNDRNQNTPTQNQFYNLSSLGITFPIGDWDIYYQFCTYVTRASNGIADINITLSTANNSESTNSFTSRFSVRGAYDGARLDGTTILTKNLRLIVAAKTAYFTNMWTTNTNITAISILNAATYGSTGIIRATCAYL